MIGQETIDRVRQHASIVSVVKEAVRLQQRGRSLVGLCPFHKEKTPSFHVNPERGLYHCFGCGASGDAIKFVQEISGLSFVEAVRELANQAGIEIVEAVDASERKQQAEARRRHAELFDVSNAAAAFFERMLREHPLRFMALDELRQRQLVSTSATEAVADALQAFRVGYAPYGWNELGQHLSKLGFSSVSAETVGLVVARKSGLGHYDRFRHRLMFAVTDLQGRVVAFSGRALAEPDAARLRELGHDPPDASKPREAPAKYLNSPESPVYKKRETVFGLYQARHAVRDSGTAVLVEGNFDVLSLHAHGIGNAVAPLGTAFTPEQARLIRRFTSEIVLMFDGDSAGLRAVFAARDAVRESGLVGRVAFVPQGSDPDQMLRDSGVESVRKAISASRGMLEFLIDSTLDRGFMTDDALSRASKIRAVARLLAEETDPEVRAMARHYADRIAERLGIADAPTFLALSRRVRGALDRESPPGDSGANPERPLSPSQARSPDRRQAVGMEILGSVLDHPDLVQMPELKEATILLEGDLAAAMAALGQVNIGRSASSIEQFLAKLPPSIHAFAASRLAAPRYEQLGDARTVLLQNITKLRRLEQLRAKHETMQALQQAAASGDFDAELELLRQQMRQAQQRHGVGER